MDQHLTCSGGIKNWMHCKHWVLQHPIFLLISSQGCHLRLNLVGNSTHVCWYPNSINNFLRRNIAVFWNKRFLFPNYHHVSSLCLAANYVLDQWNGDEQCQNTAAEAILNTFSPMTLQLTFSLEVFKMAIWCYMVSMASSFPWTSVKSWIAWLRTKFWHSKVFRHLEQPLLALCDENPQIYCVAGISVLM